MRTTAKDRAEIIAALIKLGISYHDAEQLRRISKTLNRWFEMECGTENASGASISIERDEQTEKPFQRIQYATPLGYIDRKYPIADREAGARKRLAAIMEPYKRRLVPYIQGDCRGASLFILRRADVRGQHIDSVYNRGVAVY